MKLIPARRCARCSVILRDWWATAPVRFRLCPTCATAALEDALRDVDDEDQR